MRLEEIRDIVIASAVLAFVFSYEGISRIGDFISNLPLAVFAVVTGFILHELAHRYFARRYGAHAEFKMWKEGLLLAIGIALLTNGAFVFAAPGAVMIYPRSSLWGHTTLTKRKMGIIAIAGPVVNIILASIFLVINVYYPSQLFKLGALVNIWLALFNMLPIPPLDGSKVFYWDKRIWVASFVTILAMFLVL